MNAPNWGELLRQLSQPFPEQVIKWRAGSTSRDKTRAQALAYVDPRAYERRLDELAPGAWGVAFEPWGERIICKLTIHGVTRSSTGEANEGGFAVGTAAEAQAFKRACSKFGLGRHIYNLPTPWVAYDRENRRLAEKPRVPAPKPSPAPHPSPTARGGPSLPASGAQVQPAVTEKPQLETLSRARAEAMHRELSKLGLRREQHYEVCEYELGCEVKSLTTLTEPEAVRVWNRAKREVSTPPRPRVSDAEAQSILN